jgi:trehalose-6-phosphate synthase
MKRMSESLVGRALIIGVDRLDYSKGCRIASKPSIS